MPFYEVGVASKSHHSQSPLTYRYDSPLALGTVVAVSLRRETAIGLVLSETKRPRFTTKPIERILSPKPLPAKRLELLRWLMEYYPAPLGAIIQLFVPSALLRQPRNKEEPAPAKIAQVQSLPRLTAEQSAALKSIRSAKASTVVLHGITGSGKTRIYLELAKREFEKHRSVIVLTPEIGLTPQMVATFQRVFGDSVLTGHSTLSDAERRTLWLQVLTSTKPLVLIGPRSMLFYPLDNVGLVVVDEMHELAYKQEQAPHYQTVRVASKLAGLEQATLILGSATPSIEDIYIAGAKKIPIVKLTQLAAGEFVAPTTTVVDLRNRDNLSTHPFLSTPLLAALDQTLKHREQVLLFLNRRGTARLILCQNCGWQALCPRCDIPLTYHGDQHQVRCHSCGFSQEAPNQCPLCRSSEIIFRSIGTKALADEVRRLYPKANVRRFDTDNRKAERFETQYDDAQTGKIDILVGTQVLGKGLDLPKLSLVGVVAADSSLHFPDFSAEERTFQLLTQVLGRVNRGHRPGQAVIQTYTPDNPTIQAVVARDWQTFYDQQIKERQLFGWPPFRYLLQLTVRKASQQTAKGATEKLKTTLEAKSWPIEIIGPSPAYQEKTAGKYQWQLVVKAKRRSLLLSVIKELPAGWSYNIDPVNLL